MAELIIDSIVEAKEIQKNPEIKSPCQNPMLRKLEIPEGYLYKWVRLGITRDKNERQEYYNVENFIAHQLGGWKAVPHSRHPEMPKEGEWIIYGNNLLAEWQLPKQIESEREEIEKRIAENNINSIKHIDPLRFIPEEHKDGFSKYFTATEFKYLE